MFDIKAENVSWSRYQIAVSRLSSKLIEMHILPGIWWVAFLC